ncbi:hypothetical protein IHE45_02G012700 [Dioscorea alata]|uniref:Uncharacterized protein n=1 Tax=Dioscorea alata TaxID=55571 RepID=A0ACB7WP40_DIOAL|nr:hypothetical protein IHE45_02G012700 [Dioscorea alata]
MAVEWLRIYVPMEACGSRLEKERRGDCVFDLSGQLERLLLLDLARSREIRISMQEDDKKNLGIQCLRGPGDRLKPWYIQIESQ